MKKTGRCISILAAIFYSVIFFGAASPVQANKDSNVYIWEFGTRNGTRDEATRNITQEFETAFIGTQCCTVLERRNYNRLLTQKENEKAVMSIDGITDASVNTLKTLEADVVMFGEVYDDIASGEVKVSVVVQDFTGKSLLKQSIRFLRGKLSDAASREKNMNDLANKVCSALVEEKVVKHVATVKYSFTAYELGDIVPKLGKHNMIVKTKQGKALTSASSLPATFILQGFSYKNMVLEINLDLGRIKHKISFLDKNKEVLFLKLTPYDAIFGDYTNDKVMRKAWKGGKEINNLKIKIQNNIARFYLNDIFSGLQEITFDTIDKITVAGIKREKDFIYSVSVKPLN
ncbi:MAG: hypothetical protein D3905_04720 [Candidatus Electrothrix sp. AS4_5]|nr:hypothetical protein [Candidatus Electrothrix gigas]